MNQSYYADANYTREGFAIDVVTAWTTTHNAYYEKTYPPGTRVHPVSVEEWAAVRGKLSGVAEQAVEAGELVPCRFPDWTYRFVSTDKLSYQ